MVEPLDEEALKEWRRQSERDTRRKHLRHLELEYEDSGNALYVWEAISVVTSYPEVTEGEPQTFPPWVIAYLKEVSDDIAGLARGSNWRSARKAAEANRPINEVFADLKNGIRPSECVTVALESLRFTSPGKNAFSEYRSRDEALDEWVEYNDLLDDGLSPTQALREMLNAKDGMDERHLRRRLAAARKRFEKS